MSTSCSSRGESQEFERANPHVQAHFKPLLTSVDIPLPKSIQVAESRVKHSRMGRVGAAPTEVGGREGLEVCGAVIFHTFLMNQDFVIVKKMLVTRIIL